MQDLEIDIENKIREYGEDILCSEYYRQAFEQAHHGGSSVAKHSLRVAMDTLKVCRFFRQHGIKVDERKAVRAALMHDLGILGRDDKFDSQYEMSRQHPIESVKVARLFEPQMDETVKQAIERHMFPVFAKPPTKPEAIAVCIADKTASMQDVYHMLEEYLDSLRKDGEIEPSSVDFFREIRELAMMNQRESETYDT